MAYNNYLGYPYMMPETQPRVNPQAQQYMNPVMQQPMQQPGIVAIPVTCIDEAKAARIALDGSLTLFVDVQNNCIYSKQLNNNGLAELNIYKRVEANQTPQYVDMKSFNDLFQRVKNLEVSLGGAPDDESTNNANS